LNSLESGFSFPWLRPVFSADFTHFDVPDFAERVAILGDKLMHLGGARGSGVLQAGGAALFPVFD